jgi:membrane fusion protein (multidrug efflux system)
MTTVSQVDPIWAYFNVSENAFLNIAPRIGQIIRGTGNLKSVALPPIEFIQANGDPYPVRGQLAYVNRQVGTETGTIQMAAQFPNKSAALRPGGFGRVRIQTGLNKNALLIPQAAVIEVQSLYQVVVVGADNKASFRPVKVGEQVGTNWIISEGLKSGEKVVVEGLMKVREGTPVNPKPYVMASAAGSN